MGVIGSVKQAFQRDRRWQWKAAILDHIQRLPMSCLTSNSSAPHRVAVVHHRVDACDQAGDGVLSLHHGRSYSCQARATVFKRLGCGAMPGACRQTELADPHVVFPFVALLECVHCGCDGTACTDRVSCFCPCFLNARHRTVHRASASVCLRMISSCAAHIWCVPAPGRAWCPGG